MQEDIQKNIEFLKLLYLAKDNFQKQFRMEKKKGEDKRVAFLNSAHEEIIKMSIHSYKMVLKIGDPVPGSFYGDGPFFWPHWNVTITQNGISIVKHEAAYATDDLMFIKSDDKIDTALTQDQQDHILNNLVNRIRKVSAAEYGSVEKVIEDYKRDQLVYHSFFKESKTTPILASNIANIINGYL